MMVLQIAPNEQTASLAPMVYRLVVCARLCDDVSGSLKTGVKPMDNKG